MGLVIWRYMSIPAFVSLLQTGELIFTRVDQFSDQHEGVISRPTLERVIAQSHEAAQEHFKDSLEKKRLTHEKLWRFVLDMHKDSMEHSRKRAFVNCWHANESESVAMWDLYSKNGVAIRSSAVDLIMGSLPTRTLFCQVKYVDHLSEEVNDLWPFLFKRREYAHESEYRAFLEMPREILLDAVGNEVHHIPVKYDLCRLIHEVRVAPGIPSWTFKAVQTLLTTYGLSEVPCNRAQADQLPDFLAEIEHRMLNPATVVGE